MLAHFKVSSGGLQAEASFDIGYVGFLEQILMEIACYPLCVRQESFKFEPSCNYLTGRIYRCGSVQLN
jgi:hypothetical protein